MDVREKLVEIIQNSVGGCARHWAEVIADGLIANGVTVQEDCQDCAEATQNCIVKLQEQISELRSAHEWISVDDRLPQYTDEYNVTVGVPNEFGYFEKVKTLRFERIKGKEPRWVIPKNEIYNVIAWMELPKKYQPPKGE